MSKKKISSVTRLTVSAMTTALGVLFMFGASLLPAGKLGLLFLASLVIWIPLNERGGVLSAILCYLATAGVTFLIVPNKLYAGVYLIFFGLYGFLKLGLDSLIPDRIIAFIVRLIVVNGIAVLVVLIGGMILGQSVFAMIPENYDYPLYIAIPALELAFAAYELLYTFCISMFDSHLRDKIIPRK